MKAIKLILDKCDIKYVEGDKSIFIEDFKIKKKGRYYIIPRIYKGHNLKEIEFYFMCKSWIYKKSGENFPYVVKMLQKAFPDKFIISSMKILGKNIIRIDEDNFNIEMAPIKTPKCIVNNKIIISPLMIGTEMGIQWIAGYIKAVNKNSFCSKELNRIKQNIPSIEQCIMDMKLKKILK